MRKTADFAKPEECAGGLTLGDLLAGKRPDGVQVAEMSYSKVFLAGGPQAGQLSRIMNGTGKLSEWMLADLAKALKVTKPVARVAYTLTWQAAQAKARSVAE